MQRRRHYTPPINLGLARSVGPMDGGDIGPSAFPTSLATFVDAGNDGRPTLQGFR